jgi:hypothetical protein
MTLKAEVDVWTTTRPVQFPNIKRADIWRYLPGKAMNVYFYGTADDEPQCAEYAPMGHRLHINQGDNLQKVRLAIELPGELVPSIPAYFWMEGEGLKIAIGRTVLAIDLKDD